MNNQYLIAHNILEVLCFKIILKIISDFKIHLQTCNWLETSNLIRDYQTRNEILITPFKFYRNKHVRFFRVSESFQSDLERECRGIQSGYAWPHSNFLWSICLSMEQGENYDSLSLSLDWVELWKFLKLKLKSSWNNCQSYTFSYWQFFSISHAW